MSPVEPQNAALLAQIVSQVENNVEFLAAQGYISEADASQILTRLPRSNRESNRLGPSLPTVTRAFPPSPASAPAPAVPQARVLWAWTGQDKDDLSIKKGDIIEIIEETNADWWTGRVNGREGVFPANYVEKVQPTVGPAGPEGKPAYKPFRAAYHGMDQPPPATVETNSVGLQEAPGKEEKKGKFGNLGNTMAHSAAGGVGFGAGAAIGGGLVRAIF